MSLAYFASDTMGNEFRWMTVAYVYEPSAAIGLDFVTPKDWFATTKYFVDRGIVFRDVAETSEIWKRSYVVRKYGSEGDGSANGHFRNPC